MESLLRGENKLLWDRSLSNEFGRLAQGNKYDVVATDIIEFIFSHEVPSNKGVTYASFVCDYSFHRGGHIRRLEMKCDE